MPNLSQNHFNLFAYYIFAKIMSISIINIDLLNYLYNKII